ncbi:TIGR02444 family protein [Pseudoalteromonas sp. SSDWG2]|uniref:TIGR02444 family protein n=1 Tax=Pseudoalteromonas sp. SSDWG2 TaxID=3139391 RepID=UPI003BA9AC5D
MSKISASQFWQFSLHTYANEQVQHTLLHWQNEHRLNVNLCLLLAYLDCHQLAISPVQLETLTDVINEFDQHALQPLRSVRAFLKSEQQHITHYADMRKQMLALELEFEKHQQAELIAACNALSMTTHAHPNNLTHYLPKALLPLKNDLDQALHSVSY